MRKALHALCWIAFCLFGCVEASAQVCGLTEKCFVEGGEYRTSPPAGWDGHSPLPVAIFFHGHRGSAEEGMENAGLRRAFSDLGVLLIFAEGVSGSWEVGAGAKATRDNIGYTRSVLADVRRRWPVAEPYVWAAGFSEGAFMVWNLACNGHSEFLGYVALSGAFIEPLPQNCPAGPVNLLEFHGLTDEVVPMEGRQIGSSFVQGDLFASLAVMRRIDGCRRNPDDMRSVGSFVVRKWETCASEKRLGVAIHQSGHEMIEGWIEMSWDWVKGLATAIPVARR